MLPRPLKSFRFTRDRGIAENDPSKNLEGAGEKSSILPLFSRRHEKFEADLVTALAARGKSFFGIEAHLVRLTMLTVQHSINPRLRNHLPRLV